MGSQRVRHDLVTKQQVSHCRYIPHLLYSFICWWTFRLLPCHGYCKQCCYEYRCACISLSYSFFWIYAQEWGHWIIWQLYFLGKLHTALPVALPDQLLCQHQKQAPVWTVLESPLPSLERLHSRSYSHGFTHYSLQHPLDPKPAHAVSSGNTCVCFWGRNSTVLGLVGMSAWQWSPRAISWDALHPPPLALTMTGHPSYCVALGTLLSALQ